MRARVPVIEPQGKGRQVSPAGVKIGSGGNAQFVHDLPVGQQVQVQDEAYGR